MPDVQQLMGEARRVLAAPSRTPRTAVVIGRLLAIAFMLCFFTGVYSHFLQDPLPWMRFTTRPTFLYQWTQGIHITAGILCFPLLFAKLYAVFPELFQTPPIRSFPHFLERASITLFVSASLVQIVTGMLNTYQWYALFPFPFRQTHYALSYVIIGSLAIHIALKLPIISAHWTKAASAATVAASYPLQVDVGERGVAADPTTATPGPSATSTTATTGVTGRIFSWIDRTPDAPPRASRRAFIATVGVASAALVATTAGQSFKVLDGTNIFAPRKAAIGPNNLPVNRTAAAAKVTETAVAPDWTLTVTNGSTSTSYSRAELAALPQHQVDLPIACVEGWSQTARWRGPRLRDLLDAVGADPNARIRLTSLEQKSSYAVTEMGPEYARDELTLVALELGGKPLDINHGYPARMIAPGRPGVMQTKWLSSLETI
jgi:hypothetical protein